MHGGPVCVTMSRQQRDAAVSPILSAMIDLHCIIGTALLISGSMDHRKTIAVEIYSSIPHQHIDPDGKLSVVNQAEGFDPLLDDLIGLQLQRAHVVTANTKHAFAARPEDGFYKPDGLLPPRSRRHFGDAFTGCGRPARQPGYR